MRKKIAIALLLAAAGFLAAQAVPGQSGPPAKPAPANKCPVCGMFVAGFPDFLAAVVFTDGATAYFDGCKDMFRFLFEMDKYAPGRKRSDVAAVWVTDYYSLGWIDGAKAFYVRGSDILGPMGRELIPFGKEPEAKVFIRDHRGESLFRFDEITPDVLKGVD
jgi:nitrous oxide reductase accessory protein NosL